ncbi:hypothetical protein A3709_07980 [Halioglobus sp. HI00S01]|uniref:aconitase X swivel domain-containing protein n=1 Tax=Halioglobus sp. HI00S01 TaxID=1822214 RepID=UPI0007C28A62|nr:DUF126 domain-containing protein [Halioglobus sp. HI00S01]KZX54939.1 hypothetical protein A3709_07980 [Halioglobus sp. HI00S01]
MALGIALDMLVDGSAEGRLMVLSQGLSFWGGLEPASGMIVDNQHPQRGACVGSRILVLPAPRGSTAAPGALLECLAAGRGPAAIVLAYSDPTAVAAVLAASMIDLPAIPVALIANTDVLAQLPDGQQALVSQGQLMLR